jgi:DNA-binding transcriptional regulator YiaG
MDEVNEMEISKKVRLVREKLEISQEDLARALNVSYATINRWENAKTKPTRMALAVFYDYCEKHGISFDEGEDKI